METNLTYLNQLLSINSMTKNGLSIVSLAEENLNF